ncbi:hypothetical protein D3C81_914390 [compost metagenome]
MQLRMVRLDPHQRLGQAPRQHRVDRPQAQAAAQARAAGQGVGQFVIASQDGLGAGHRQLAGFGQRHLPAAAVEQGHLQFVFEGLDVQAHRRRGEAEQVGGTGEGAVAGDGDQGAQGFEGHAKRLQG